MRADARDHGQLVNAFLPDHRAVHIGQQHPFGTALGRLDDQVNARILQVLPDRPLRIGTDWNSKLSGLFDRQPQRRAATPGIAQVFDQSARKGAFGRRAQQGDGEHGQIRSEAGA